MYESDFHPSDESATATCDTEHLNTLLRGELSAVETYELALTRMDGHCADTALHHALADHRSSVTWLRERVKHFGSEPAESPGLWGAFASLVSESARMLGPITAIAALKQGEQYGINEYEEALRDEDIAPECKDYIRNRLIPSCEQHILELDHLMSSAESKT